ncbi:MAG TPA: hypothetical protein VIK92_10090 [Thermaerobacter sp.]
MAQIHAFLGPIVFVVVVLQVIWTGYRMLTGRSLPAERPLTGLYIGLLDLQALLGLILLATVGAGRVSLIHPVLMLVAVIDAHIGLVLSRRPGAPAALPFAFALSTAAIVAFAYPAP